MTKHDETFSDRLRLAMDRAGISQAQLAQAIGMSQPSIWKLLSGKTNTSRKLVEIAQFLNVSAEWLSSGYSLEQRELPGLTVTNEPKKKIDSYRVDVLDVQASAGHGVERNSDFIETIRAIEYTTEQARALFGNRSSESVKVITVRGDSMSGTIEPGDYIFVDISIDYFDGDGVYVFVYGQTIHVKRLQMIKNKLLVLSDNKLYDSWHIDQTDEDEFHILAKVLLKQSADFKRFA